MGHNRACPVWCTLRLNYLAILALLSLLLSSCGFLDSWSTEDLNRCAEECSGKECGVSDSCDCGTCSSDEACLSGTCLTCEERCGWEDCGMKGNCYCGGCPERHACNHHNLCACVPECTSPHGIPYECGDSGCSEPCGDCEFGECIDNSCFCEPDCADKVCGSDGCGGTCGYCTFNDPLCHAGQCYEMCDGDGVIFPIAVQRVSAMQLGKGGHDGEALDVDGDPDTCSPTGDCESGLNNMLSDLAEQLRQYYDSDQELDELLLAEGFLLAMRFVGPVEGGAPFTIEFYQGAAELSKSACDYTLETCGYMAWSSSFEPTGCEPLYVLHNATLDGNLLTAGGMGHVIPIINQFTLVGPVRFLPAYNGQMMAEAVVDDNQVVALSNGLFAGVFRKTDLMNTIIELPEDEEMPVSKDMLMNLLDMFITPDIDTDGDGVKDGASLAYTFSTISGNIVGVLDDPATVLP
jgi:hypothetical protein